MNLRRLIAMVVAMLVLAACAAAPAGTPGSTPAAGTPAGGTSAVGTPAAGTPAGGTPAAGTPAGGTPVAGTPASGERVRIGFVTHVIGNPFIQQIIDGAEAAAEDLDVELQVTGPEGGDADAQLQAVETLVASGVDGIATSVPGEGMVSRLNEIVDSGIPVVQFNLLQTGVNAPYVGERSVESGRILGRRVIEDLGGTEATGTVIIGNCFPGFPVLENRAAGVQEALAEAPGLEVLGPFDVKVAANENYAAWEALLTANPDAVALIGLCAPDVASLGQLAEANPDADFVAGGYDLTQENLAQIEAGNAHVSLGQMPFMQGYLPVKMLVDSIREGVDLSQGGFVDAGTEIVTRDEVIQPYDLPPLTFEELQELAASPERAREYYQPLVEGVIEDWQDHLEPIEAESE